MAETSDLPIPPANFLFLVESILMQAQIQLGLLNLGEQDEKPEPNLPLARHSIDLLGMLQEKTQGNLSVEEQRLLENGLTELRFRFVQVSDELKRKDEPRIYAPLSQEKKPDEGPRIITADGGKGTKTE
ncbi:MAG: DUF1844 domain-containing protein [Acidobacteriaceae bacterium]|nr:DUF1844 domain-containing protein [Acidobacteriaceae bacterium]